VIAKCNLVQPMFQREIPAPHRFGQTIKVW